MRIAVWHNLPSGGGKRALYDQVRGLLARGHEVEAWCPPSADQDYLPLNRLVPEHVVPLGLKPATGLLSKMNPLYWHTPLRLELMERHCRKAAEEIHRGGFDLLFAASCGFFFAPMIARHIRMPTALYLGEPFRPLYESLPELPWLAPSFRLKDWANWRYLAKAVIAELKLPGIRLQGREERRNAMAFDAILVNSLFSRESILRAYGIDSKVCYLGIDAEQFINRHQQREPIAVSVGMLNPQKNAEFVVRALAKVAARMRPKLVWVANMVHSPYLESVRRLAADADVDLEVKYRIDDAELVDILNRARVMVYAPRLEPFGYAPLEANACGVPVIAVAEGGIRETIEAGCNGVLVEHDPQCMAAAIEQLMSDDELHSRLSNQASELVRTKWRLEDANLRLEKRLNAVLNKARGISHAQASTQAVVPSSTC